jgi:peptide/nickel transport system ATP-binding protein
MPSTTSRSAVAERETLALVGESGCGKTTTGKAIVQLLRGSATFEGQALLQGRNLFELSGQALVQARRDIQIIFQDPFASLNPRMRVVDILDEGMAPCCPRSTRRRAASASRGWWTRWACAATRWTATRTSSRAASASASRSRARWRCSPLIVCDEPTSALDVSVQAQILNLLHDLQQELGVSYLFITHNIGVVEYIADRVAVMRAGVIVEQGDSVAVLEHPQQRYTRDLIDAVPRLDLPV